MEGHSKRRGDICLVGDLSHSLQPIHFHVPSIKFHIGGRSDVIRLKYDGFQDPM